MDFGRGSYGHHFDVDKVLSSLSEEQLFERVVCGICRDFPIGAMQTDVSTPFLSFFPRSEDWKLTQRASADTSFATTALRTTSTSVQPKATSTTLAPLATESSKPPNRSNASATLAKMRSTMLLVPLPLPQSLVLVIRKRNLRRIAGEEMRWALNLSLRRRGSRRVIILVETFRLHPAQKQRH